MSDPENLTAKIKEYQKILAQDRKSLVFAPLSLCYLKSGLIDDALETALKGTWELPEHAPGYVVVARVYAQRKVYNKAEAAYQKAIDVDPSCLDAYKGMAKMYYDQGNVEAASNFLTKAIFIFPDEPSLKKMLESLSSTQTAPPSEPAVSAPAQGENGMQPITTATIAEIYIKQELYDKALEVYRELYNETQDPSVAQKIAEIEAMSQGSTPEAAVMKDNVFREAEPAAISNESVPVHGASVLDHLNSLLSSIQARRNRV